MSLRHKALLAVLATAILWGSAGTVGKLLIREAHPFVIIMYRFGAATLLVLPFFLRAKKPKGWLPDLLPLGLFNATNVLFYFSGLALTTANTGSLLGTGVPILTVLLSWILIREPVSREKMFGIIIGLIGAVLIVLVPILDRGQAIGTSITGNLLMVGSAIAWTLYIVRSRSSGRVSTFSPVVATFVNFATCTAASLLASIITRQNFFVPALFTPTYALLFLYMVIGITVVTFFLFQWALQHISATTASLKEYFQLIIGVSINAVILGERLTPVFLLGSSLVIIGVVVSTGSHLSRRLVALIESRSM